MQAIISIEGKTYDTFPTFTQNDKGWFITFIIKYNDDSVVDLTGATVAFRMMPLNGGAVKVNGTCVLITPLAGTCKYTIVTGDFDTVGNFDTEVQVTMPGSIITTVKTGKLQVVQEIA